MLPEDDRVIETCRSFLSVLISILDCNRVRFVCFFFLSFFLARQPPLGQGLLIHEVSRSHTTTHHSR